MKVRLIALLIIVGVILGLCCAYENTAAGCTQNESEYKLYFQQAGPDYSAGGSALATVPAQNNPKLQTDDTIEIAKELLTQLLTGPVKEQLKNTIPQGTTLNSISLEGGHVLVDFSSSYGTLSGIGLTLADSAVTLTLTQVPEIFSVKITVRGQDLSYREQQTLTARKILLEQEGDVLSKVKVHLYFLDEQNDLAPEERILSLYEGDTQVSAVVKALEDGPVSKALFPVMPEEFRVRSVWQEGSVCYINLTSAMLIGMTEKKELYQITRALEQSLMNLDTVQEVRFLVDGTYTRDLGTINLTEAIH